MDALLEWLRAAIALSPRYWAGVGCWTLGFVLYLPIALGGRRHLLGTAGAVLCCVGLALTIAESAGLEARRLSVGMGIRWTELIFWQRTEVQIWVLWLAGAALVVGAGTRIFARRMWWIGLCTAMAGSIASWPASDYDRGRAVVIGIVAVGVLWAAMWMRGQLYRQLPKQV